MGDFYQDIRDRANQRRAAINNGLPNATTLGANPDQSDEAQRQRLANVAGATGGLYTGAVGLGGDLEALIKAIYRSNKERDVLGREKEGYRGLGAHIDDIYNSTDTFLTNSYDAREDVKNFVGDNEVGDLLSEASENAWLTGEILAPLPTKAGLVKGYNQINKGVDAVKNGDAQLALLENGLDAKNAIATKADRFLDNFTMNFIERIDDKGISKTNGKPVVPKADLDSFKKKRQANIENHKEVGMDVEDADEATTLAHYQETGQVIRYDPENKAYVVIKSDVGKFETPELVDNDYFSGDMVDGRFVYDNANTVKELKMDDAIKYPEYFDAVPEAKNIKMNASLLGTDSVPPKFQKSKKLTEQWDNMTPAQKENAVYADGGAMSSGGAYNAKRTQMILESMKDMNIADTTEYTRRAAAQARKEGITTDLNATRKQHAAFDNILDDLEGKISREQILRLNKYAKPAMRNNNFVINGLDTEASKAKYIDPLADEVSRVKAQSDKLMEEVTQLPFGDKTRDANLAKVDELQTQLRELNETLRTRTDRLANSLDMETGGKPRSIKFNPKTLMHEFEHNTQRMVGDYNGGAVVENPLHSSVNRNVKAAGNYLNLTGERMSRGAERHIQLGDGMLAQPSYNLFRKKNPLQETKYAGGKKVNLDAPNSRRTSPSDKKTISHAIMAMQKQAPYSGFSGGTKSIDELIDLRSKQAIAAYGDEAAQTKFQKQAINTVEKKTGAKMIADLGSKGHGNEFAFRNKEGKVYGYTLDSTPLKSLYNDKATRAVQAIQATSDPAKVAMVKEARSKGQTVGAAWAKFRPLPELENTSTLFDTLRADQTNFDNLTPRNNPESIDSVLDKEKYWRTLNKKPDAPVNPEGIDATGYNPKVSDRALGNQGADVTVPNEYNNFNTIPNKDPYPALNRSSVGSQEEALLTQQGREFKFGADKNKAWTEAFGNPTGSGKLKQNRRVNPDTGLTYDGSEFPKSIDPRARNITPNGQPAPVSPVKEQDILLDADGNFVNQPAEGLNSNAIKNTKEADLVGADGGLLNGSQSPLASMIESTSKIGEATRGRLQRLPQGIKDIVNKASTKDEMIEILNTYHKKAKAKSVLTDNDIKALRNENLNLVDNSAQNNKSNEISDTHFTNKLDNTNEVPLTSNVKDVMDDLSVGLTNADAIADAKVIKNLYNNRVRNPDDLMNNLTTKATELQAKPVSADNNKLINAIHHALIDVVNRNYKGVKPTTNSQLTKTANQYLNRVGMEITEGTDGLQVKTRKYDREEQLFNEMGGKPKARNLDDYDNAATDERIELGKEYTDPIDDVLKDLVKTSKKKPNKRTKRSQLTQKQDDALYTGDWPDYNQGRIKKKDNLFDSLEGNLLGDLEQNSTSYSMSPEQRKINRAASTKRYRDKNRQKIRDNYTTKYADETFKQSERERLQNFRDKNKVADNKRSRDYYNENKEKISERTKEIKIEKALAEGRTPPRPSLDTIKQEWFKELPIKLQDEFKSIRANINAHKKTNNSRRGHPDDESLRHSWLSKHSPDYAFKHLASGAQYRATKLKRTPKGQTKADKQEIQDIYAESQRMSKETGESYHVDHIIPLQPIKFTTRDGRKVTLKQGWHEPENLEVIKGSDNVSKSNKITPEQYEAILQRLNPQDKIDFQEWYRLKGFYD